MDAVEVYARPGRRDHGGVAFIDLRDASGSVQVVIRDEKVAGSLRAEWCLLITGEVVARPAGNENTNLATGEIEVMGDTVVVLSEAAPLPFPVDSGDDTDINEEVRLRYRYLDLRREKPAHNLRLRSKVTSTIRRVMEDENFLEIETPYLTRSTPEGARDFLVPVRLQPGSWYALPQSPQLFKQLLMVAGMEKYYQIARCFRDEDFRADRQPEFTQLDIEMSFIDQEDILAVAEKILVRVWKEVLDYTIEMPIPRMTYLDAMARFGSDKPDLRVNFEFTELTDLMKDVDFKVFSGAANQVGGRVVGLCVPGGAEISRSEIDDYTQFVSIYGAKGLAWIKVNSVAEGRNGLQSPIVKNLHDAAIEGILKRTGAKDGDIIFFGADKEKVVNDAIGNLRLRIGQSAWGKEHGLFTEGWKPLWVVDFPMFDYDEGEARWVACHHPFTSPKDEHMKYLESDPGKCLAKAYDMVLNGSEIGGGSVRIHQEAVQSQVFRALKIGAEEAQAKFGFLLDALQYGAPPHGGIAFGLDRIVTMMTGAESIRDVIAFPKTQRAQCLLTQAPSPVDERQLRELHIRLRQAAPAA